MTTARRLPETMAGSDHQRRMRSMGSSDGYTLEGSLLEACSCKVLCPCWIGEDPDHGTCESFNAYHLERGEIGGVDVSGLSAVTVNRIPGNVLTPASWVQVLFIDERADDAQLEAIRAAFQGELGGPLVDLAGLVGERLGVERARIRHETREGKGVLEIAESVAADMRPYTGPDGSITTLRDSVFSTVPGSPAYVAIADSHRVDLPEYGMEWRFEGRNAIQSDWKLEHTGTA
jgi:hypothetical protein